MLKTTWQSLVSLFRAPREPYVPSSEPFLKLDVDALRARLRPSQYGEAAGSQNLPSSDASSPDSRESEITRVCQEELELAFARVTRGIDTHLVSIRQLSGASAASEISQLRDSALSELNAVARDRGNRIEATLQHARELTEAFGRFRKAHARDSLPDASRGQALGFAVLAVMIAVESAFNGYMFAPGSDFGLLGGVIQAAVFSAVNVGLGALTGVCVVRQLYHVSWWKRVAGSTGLVAAGAAAVILNFGVAHFRDAMVHEQDQNQAAAVALHALLSYDLTLADMISWLLFGLGLVFFWIACYDGFQLDDPYPSYGRRYRRVLHAKNDYADAVSETLRAVATVRDLAARGTSPQFQTN